MNCVNGPCVVFVASVTSELVRNVLIMNETVNYVSFVSVSLAHWNFVKASLVIVSCVTVILGTVAVNLVSAASVIVSAVSLTFERITLILYEVVIFPSSFFC